MAMNEGNNGNDRIVKARTPHVPMETSGVLSTDVSGRVAETLDSGSNAVSSAFESALDRVVETWGKYRRLWLVRHFDYEDSEEAREYVKKSKEDKSKMDEDELKALNELSKKVRANVNDPFIQRIILGSLRKRPDHTKAALYLDIEESIATRNKMTYEWVDNSEELKDWFVTKRFKITTEKVDDTGEKTFRAFSEIGGIMNDWLLDEDRGDGVIFGNRTPSHAFWLRVWRPCYSEKDHTDQMERLGYDFWDVEKATGKPILIQNGKTLRVTLENLDGIEKAILDACDDADRKKKVSNAFANLPLIMLQEAVNDSLGALRASKPGEYLAVLRSLSEWKSAEEKHDPELQSYVFERHMESGFPWEALLRSEWSTGALEWMATKGYREMVIRYFWESEEGPVDNLGPFAKSINVKGMKELFADAYEYWKIRQRQKRSVDPAIRSGNAKAIVERHAYTARCDGTERRDFIDFEGIAKLSTVRNAVVLGTIGEGKSLWLWEFAKSAILEGQKIRFYEARDLSLKFFERGGKIFDDLEKHPEILFIIDGMDEIRDSEERDAIKSAIDALGKRFIIGSRPPEYAEHSEKYATVRLAQMELDDFLEGRFDDERDRERVRILVRGMRFSESAQSSQTEADPLLLAFACMLAENGDRTDVPDIRNRADLYENAAKYVLSKHSKDSKGQRDYDPSRDVNEWMKELGKRAYEKFTGTEKIGADRYSDTHLGLLYRKEGAEKYEFAHHSFYEYFLARHFAENWESFERGGHGGLPNGFVSERNSLLYLAEILANSGKTKELAEFLKKLRRFPVEKKWKGTDSVGQTPFVTWLEILHALPNELLEFPEIRKIRKKYEKDVSEIDAKWVGENYQEILEFAKRTDHADSSLILRTIDVFKSAIKPRIASKVDAEDPMSGITELCKALASIGTPSSVSTADKIESVVRNLRMSLFAPIPVSEKDFAAIRTKLAREDTQEVFWKFHKGKTDFEFHLAAVGTQPSMDAVESRIGHMPVDEMARMYETIAGGPVSRLSLEMARKGAEKMMEGGHYTPARWIYRSIFEMGTRKARSIALKWAKSLEGKCRDPWKIWANSVLFDYKAPRRLPPVTDLSKLLVLEDRWGSVIRRVSKLKKRFLS